MPEPAPMGLARLERRLARDLAYLNHPPANWVEPTRHASGRPVLDVAIIGAGMCGLVAALALLRQGVRNIALLDRAADGLEGPWVTFARMDTLRSPKQLTGPALGLPSLTFRAWYEAQHGGEAWEALGKIPRPMWMDYLRWYRRVLDLPVENGVAVARIVPDGNALRLDTDEGARYARKVVLATGRDGLGGPHVPGFVANLPRALWAHSADDIDFAALAGKRVIVVGIGASAVDNAAAALEADALEVRMLVRRPEVPRVNKLMGIGSPGFTHGFPRLSDADRWRIIHYSFATQTPPPSDSLRRVFRHRNAHLHLASPVLAVTPAGDGLAVTTPNATYAADFLILGTGFWTDVRRRPELAAFAEHIALWRDRYAPPPQLASAEMALFPYLDAQFAFTERQPGTAPFLRDVHCFNYAATLSLGKTSGDIPAVSEGAQRLAEGVAGQFYAEDIAAHWRRLLDYDKPEVLGDEWPSAARDRRTAGE